MSRRKNADNSMISVMDKNKIPEDDNFYENTDLETDNISNIIQNQGIMTMEGSMSGVYFDSRSDMDEDENSDMTVPRGVSVDDPVRMYLREIGRIKLFTCLNKS